MWWSHIETLRHFLVEAITFNGKYCEKKKKEKKMLKQLDLDSKPSNEILNKLDCVERAVQFGLEKCGEKIFKDLALP